MARNATTTDHMRTCAHTGITRSAVRLNASCARNSGIISPFFSDPSVFPFPLPFPLPFALRPPFFLPFSVSTIRPLPGVPRVFMWEAIRARYMNRPQHPARFKSASSCFTWSFADFGNTAKQSARYFFCLLPPIQRRDRNLHSCTRSSTSSFATM